MSSSIVRPFASRTTSAQFEIMLNFMENNQRLITGKLTSNFTIKDRSRLWDELTTMLNKQANGATKVGEKWRKTWSDWKSAIRAKAAAIKRRERKNGFISPREESFSQLELRLLKLLGLSSFAADFGQFSISDVRSVEDSMIYTSGDDDPQQMQKVECLASSSSSESSPSARNAPQLVFSIVGSNETAIAETKSTSDLVISLPTETKNETISPKSVAVNKQMPSFLRTETPSVPKSKPVGESSGKRKRPYEESTEESSPFFTTSESFMILMKETVSVLKQIASANEDMALAQMRLAVAGGRKAAAAERMAAAAERKATAAERRATAAERRTEAAERRSTMES